MNSDRHEATFNAFISDSRRTRYVSRVTTFDKFLDGLRIRLAEIRALLLLDL